jgi:hypothetical protein
MRETCFITRRDTYSYSIMGVRGWIVEVVDIKPLAFHCCRFEEAINPVYRTSEVLLRCSLVPDIMHGWTRGRPSLRKLESSSNTAIDDSFAMRT